MFELSDVWHSVKEDIYFEDYFKYKTIKTNKQITYYNDVIAFDIETSSFDEYDEDDLFEPDEEIYNYLKGTTIKITQAVYKEFPDFNGIRRELFGRIYFSKTDGITIDSLYHELCQEFPYYFSEDIINPYDELESILQVFYENMPDKEEDRDTKRSCMYVWQFAINGKVIIGRTWDEFINLLTEISSEFGLNSDRRMIIYVHNLAFEFEYIKDHFTWEKVFALKARKPIYALCSLGFEFRCSYILSNMSLDNVGKSLTKYPVRKLSGQDFNYDLVRHNETPLSDMEYAYCVHDVLVVSSYIKEEMERPENHDDITRLPLTSTGYCRNYVRGQCLTAPGKKARAEQYNDYHKFIKRLTISGPEEYYQMNRAFTGGYVHCSSTYARQTLFNMDSYDFTSSYPYVICSTKMPMSKGKLVEVHSYAELKKYCHLYCCLFDIKFKGITATYLNDNYISVSKCYDENFKRMKDDQRAELGMVTNNGRLVGIDKEAVISMTLTEIDMEIIAKTYTWEAISVSNFRIYKKDYLPKEIIMSVLKLYKDKTTLKGVDDEYSQDMYRRAKNLINAVYGMMVTSLIMPHDVYKDGKWQPEPVDPEKEIKKYNNSKKRFLFYAWGVWTTAAARRNLWFGGILPFGDSYVYSDTDSAKVHFNEKNEHIVRSYNKLVEKKLRMVSERYDIPFEMFAPKTIKGETKMLGVWDCETVEGHWKMFKSLGAKRYMILTAKDDLTITVSGVNKKAAIPYLIKKYGKQGAFDAFNENLKIPGEYTGKLTHYYLDEPMSGYVTDYLGNTIKYYEKSGVYFEKASYNFSMKTEYLEYLKQRQGVLFT